MIKNVAVLPVSVKGIVFEGDAVWLRKNERNEWELPGGKLEQGEQPTSTAEREILEELGLLTRATTIVDAYLYIIPGSIDEDGGVLVVSYLCQVLGKVGDFEHIGEAGAAEFRLVKLDELESIRIPEFYVRAIIRGRDLVVLGSPELNA